MIMWAHNRIRSVVRLLLGGAKRYDNLFKIIQENKCRKIMEIGTWNGNHAVQMIKAANFNFPPRDIEYYGFDLFEDASDIILDKEFAKGSPPSLSSVEIKLGKTRAKIFLYKGNTREVLPKVVENLPTMDFVFIDGGHSVETIRKDWRNVQKVMDKHTIVIFDDYWNIENAGCRGIVENLDKRKFKVEVLPPKDKFKKEWGILEINLVKVMKRSL